MPSVQLERLRPQINAIIAQYEHSDMFTRSLMSFLKSYRGNIDSSSYKVNAYTTIPRLHVPQVVLNQLEISLKYLAHTNPSQTKPIIEKLWDQKYFEPKKMALILLSNLNAQEYDFYFEKINLWVDSDIEEPIINVIFENAKRNKEFFTSKQWFNIVEKWLSSKENRLQKIGLTAIRAIIDSNLYPNLPVIFRLVEPLLSKPHVSINKNLITLVNSLIEASQPETAAFLIHLSVMYPKPEVYALIRKCISFFNQENAAEISKRLAIN